MKISKIEVFPVYPKTNYVKISTDSGLCGWGEPVVEGRPSAVASAVMELEPQLIGKDPNNIEDLFNLMYRGNFYQGGPVLTSAISGIEQALWDIKGKNLGVPVYQLIGGAAKKRQKVYAWVHGTTPEELGKNAKLRLSQGYKFIKVCITEGMEWIASRDKITHGADMLGGIRDAVGNQLEIGVDFHGRVHKTMALQLMKEIEPYNVLFVEEPVLPWNEDDLIQLHNVSTIPIATGERLYTRWDFKRLFKTGAVDIVQPDVSHAGGIWELRKIAAMAEAYDIAVAPHCPLGAIAFSSCLHLDVATPNAFIQEQVIGIHNAVNGESFDIEDKIETDDKQGYVSSETHIANAKGLFEFKDGFVNLPTNPGLGFEVDEESLVNGVNNHSLNRWEQPIWEMDDGTVTQW
ncbi:galactonate dehydratase [uncultured Sphaerochaeta sp.]|uniref:galactonate dehydratase n=1 Tax=uncultured Sphaerochaeta sp. TaxID=886478 RepID=UPI002AA71E8D|nr:galactonate dehydratase [uncultured Sphaerochaeta sp.]